MKDQGRDLSINDIIKGYKKPDGKSYAYMSIKKLLIGEHFKGTTGLSGKVAMRINKTKSDTRYLIEEFDEFTGDAVALGCIWYKPEMAEAY